MTNMKNYFICIIVVLITSLLAIMGTTSTMFYNDIPILLIFVIISFSIHWMIFIPSYILKTEKFYDITGTISYMIIFYITYLLIKNSCAENFIHMRSYITIIMISIWAIRLGLFLLIRILIIGEDKRFKNVKNSFSKFFLYFTVSGSWVFLTTFNALTLILNNSSLSNDIFLKIGIFLWIIGFSIEVIADEQKKSFKKKTENKDKFINSGLWIISRHPNYFGEILQWVSISIISFPILIGWQYLSLISPIFVIFLLTKVSGVNILEEKSDKKWGSKKAYIKYKNNTPILIPFTKYKMLHAKKK